MEKSRTLHIETSSILQTKELFTIADCNGNDQRTNNLVTLAIAQLISMVLKCSMKSSYKIR